jgi:hypothetical protein
MILRIAAVIALAMYVSSQFSPFVSADHAPVVTGWQLTHNQVDGTFQLIQHLSIVAQIIKDQQNARYLVFMFGMSSATAGVVAAVAAGMFNRAWLCLAFAIAALASATIFLQQFLAAMGDQPFTFEHGAWLWLGSMCWLVLAAVWSLWNKRRTGLRES